MLGQSYLILSINFVQAANSKEAKAQFNWHGCPQTVIFGIKFVRRFVNAGERGGWDTKAKTTFHNNRAGRQVSNSCLLIASQNDSSK